MKEGFGDVVIRGRSQHFKDTLWEISSLYHPNSGTILILFWFAKMNPQVLNCAI